MFTLNVKYFLKLIDLSVKLIYNGLIKLERGGKKIATMKELVNYRKEIGKTQREMAELLGVSKSMYEKYEYGIYKPSIKVMKRFKEIFKDFDINIFLK